MRPPAGRLGYEPAELVHPGETLAEWLDYQDMSQVQFARRASLTPKHINQVLKGSVGISPEVALAFERVTSIPARYWIQLEASYQTAKQQILEEQKLKEHTHIVDMFPVKTLERLGHVTSKSSKVEQLRELFRFFAVADAHALEEVWLKPALYRRSQAFQADEASLAAWLRLAELHAAQISTRPFDAGHCRAAIPEIRSLSRMPGVDWIKPLQDTCASVGIALVILKELPKCRINGATRWLSPEKAMIALSLRHRRNDIFWFTLFHEMCHILRHSKKETFVDTKGSGIDHELEVEADTFASRTLIPPDTVSELRQLTTATQVENFAERIGVAPGIVVGRMQHDGLIPHSQWTKLIDRYRFADE
ncbi:XRE family transcriptional regulator [Lentzea sp. NBRC 105346]|uniref:ImmA/IrrE family metallo-endopeptidase n=1 Tax=Lentzea sp. NBRC 105346 TaxID=3032205 RepID=UPI00249FF02A|nr:ImmA/IrrE family metallo-endopeptidase [Lentzea sp. NBRC 105346]GLZ29374.1 XRE family transcriptional regulator [Lentzea sp. NBRC 105346]